ncbi:MAG: AAA family ATPase [Dehalococcoidia bacterium]
MLPLCLRLKNFLSYREPPPLDFRGMHVVCLSGNNGHGKSALLDAITWAVWGCARGRRGQGFDNLVHHGQQEMWVELEFALDGRIYKVRRLYQRAGLRRHSESRLSLQVQASDDPTQPLRDISGNTIDETQERINNLVGIDYETFVQTAYLLQGEADRFTRVGPQERRRVLASILDLDIYKLALEATDARARTLDGRLAPLKDELDRLKQEVDRRPALEADLARVQAELSQLSPRLVSLQGRVEDLRLQERELRNLQRQQEDLLARASAWEGEAQALLLQAQVVEGKIQDAQAVLLRRDKIQQDLERYHQARLRLEDMERARREYDLLTQAIAEAEKAIAQQKARLEADLAHLRERLTEAQGQVERIPILEGRLRDLVQQMEALAQQEGEVKAKQAQVVALREEASGYEDRVQRADQEMRALRQRLDMLQAQAEPICPLCKSPLGTQGKAHLEAEITAQGKALRQERDTAQRAAQEARRKAQALEQEVNEALRRLEAERHNLGERRARASQELERARDAVQQASQLAQQVDTIQECLNRGTFAQEERERLAQARQSRDALSYDPSSYDALRQEVDRLQTCQREADRLAEAERDLPNLQNTLETLRQAARQRLQDAQRARDDARQAGEALQRLPALQDALQTAQKELDALMMERDRLQQNIGNLHTTLQDVQQKEQRLQDLQREVADLQRDREAYAILERAFSPQGIPTRIIESVVHDLSDMASDILRRLTNGQMALHIETTRITKSGRAAEALEVRIDDGYGERPYEMFSGGERFRIDFALRLALGKLLAQRKGRPVRTLFVDEGFGSQDAAGRMRLVEAVQAIRSDFDLIVVITHLDELKDHFPTRIEVTKTPQGSQYEVVIA